MKLVSIISNDFNQVFRLTLSSGKYIDVNLIYKQQQYGWFISFDYGDFSIKNFRVTTSGNFLHQFRNIIPFGLSCVTTDGQEPTLSDDFLKERAFMYFLNSDDVESNTKVISGETTT